MRDASSRESSYDEDRPIARAAVTVGRIIREGKALRVEAVDLDGSHRLLGYYERTEATTFPRKVREIDDIFDAWSKAVIGDGSNVKASWRKRDAVPAFRDIPGADRSGCAVVEDDGIPIAYVYKLTSPSAIWVDA